MDKVKKLFSHGHNEEHAAGRADESYQKEGVKEGTEGGLIDQKGNYGAAPGTGISSYTGNEGSGSSGAGHSSYGTSDPGRTTGSSGAMTGGTSSSTMPGTFNDDPTSGPGSTSRSGVGENVDTYPVRTSSAMPGATNMTGNSSGLTGTSLADRSVGDSSNYGSSTTGTTGTSGAPNTFAERGVDLSGSAHPTFTGNRLDPSFEESTQSYHEEKLDDKTHHGGGWKSGAAPSNTSSATGASAMPSSGTGMGSSSDPASAYTSRGDSSYDSQRAVPSTTSTSTQPTTGSSHNYGRDAAIGTGAAGAGAAGYGMLEKGQGEPVDPYETGPASKTTGPHSSNFANIMDPRVKPEPAKMHEHTTVGPHQSDTFNTMDPRVTSNPEKAYATQAESSGNNYGRDAALAGGAGAVGGAAYSDYDNRSAPQGASGYTSSQHPTTTTSGQGSTGAGPYSTFDGGRAAPEQTTGHHYGRDAAIAGGAGAGGVGAYEATQPQSTSTLPPQPSTGTSQSHQHRWDHHDPVGHGITHGTSTGDYEKHYSHNPLKHSSHETFQHDPTGYGTTHGSSPGVGSTTAGSGAAIGGGGGHGAEEGRQSFDEEGRPKKRGLMDKILHRDSPNKLHKEPPSGDAYGR